MIHACRVVPRPNFLLSDLCPLPTRPAQLSAVLQAQEEAAQAESAAAMDFSRRRSAPVGDAWRPSARDDFASARDGGPSYQTCMQSKSRGASSQDSEGSQPQEPSQKCVPSHLCSHAWLHDAPALAADRHMVTAATFGQ